MAEPILGSSPWIAMTMKHEARRDVIHLFRGGPLPSVHRRVVELAVPKRSAIEPWTLNPACLARTTVR